MCITLSQPYKLQHWPVFLQVTPNNYTKLREIKDLLKLMVEAVSEKLLVKTLEKYSTRLDELIALDPSLQQNQEEVENVSQMRFGGRQSEIVSRIVKDPDFCYPVPQV